MTTIAYYTALGSIINDILVRVLKAVLGLRDIPEVESQRLAALCRILHPLDELFVESADEVTLLSYLSKDVLRLAPGFQCCRICAVMVKVYIYLRHSGAHLLYFLNNGNRIPNYT